MSNIEDEYLSSLIPKELDAKFRDFARGKSTELSESEKELLGSCRKFIAARTAQIIVSNPDSEDAKFIKSLYPNTTLITSYYSNISDRHLAHIKKQVATTTTNEEDTAESTFRIFSAI